MPEGYRDFNNVTSLLREWAALFPDRAMVVDVMEVLVEVVVVVVFEVVEVVDVEVVVVVFVATARRAMEGRVASAAAA